MAVPLLQVARIAPEFCGADGNRTQASRIFQVRDGVMFSSKRFDSLYVSVLSHLRWIPPLSAAIDPSHGTLVARTRAFAARKFGPWHLTIANDAIRLAAKREIHDGEHERQPTQSRPGAKRGSICFADVGMWGRKEGPI